MTGQSCLLFLDDSKQNDAPRHGIGGLVAIGGISVAASQANELNLRLAEECLSKFGLPSDAPFKWSPPKKSWFKKNLSDEQRGELLKHVLTIVKEYDPSAIVSLCELATSPLAGADTHEMSALLMVMERFHTSIGFADTGIIIIDRPAGGKTDEESYLTTCADIAASGSKYAQFKKLACPIVSMPFSLSRILQIADLVVSITTAHFAGRPAAAEFFPYVLPLLKTLDGRRGGASVKIHPDFKYANLYHWLLEDEYLKKGSIGVPMPLKDRPYRHSSETY